MWILLALAASLLWGLVYTLGEQVYRHISVELTLAILSLFAFFSMLFVTWLKGTLKTDMEVIIQSKGVLSLVVALTIAFILAEVCIGFSIKGSNATVAAIIEISYPLFTALFAYLLFKEVQLTPAAFAGALLIISGAVLVSTAGR